MPVESVSVDIKVNGEARRVSAGETVLSLLGALGIEASRVAVELNRRIVKQRDWATTPIENGAELEIVQFVGGG
jgi:thiamine biosynthesis protein ThiS